MKNDPLKPFVFKELNTRDKIFLFIMIILVIVVMLPWGADDDSYENYSPQRTNNHTYRSR